MGIHDVNHTGEMKANRKCLSNQSDAKTSSITGTAAPGQQLSSNDKKKGNPEQRNSASE